MSDDAARLDAARKRLIASFAAQQSTDAVLDVAQHLGLLGNALLTDSLNRLSETVQQARREQQEAMAEYEEAFTDRMTAIVLAEHMLVVNYGKKNRAAILEIRDALQNMAELIGYPIITPACDALIDVSEPQALMEPAAPSIPRRVPPYRMPPPNASDPDDPTGRG